jgi:two-component system, NtrC family, response regulator PilR
VGEIPLQLQAKLLRALQEREIRRIGATEDRKVDVRIVAASNRDLEAQVREGRVREDLFYRLNVVQVNLPPLRERPEDIPLLAEHFYKKYAADPASGTIIAPEALKVMLSYPFPGNVRELENLVERALALGDRLIAIESLPEQMIRFRDGTASGEMVALPESGMNLESYLDGIEKQFLLKALERSSGVKKKAAAFLGLSFRSFRYRLAKFGMDDDRE